MGFVNVSLALGGLLVGIPIVLHLVMRQRPKQLVFPAIRFVQRRRESNVRKLQLRHWLLLALRCLIIGLLAAALARPRVSAGVFGNWLLVGGLSLLLVGTVAVGTVAGIQRRGRAVLTVIGSAAVVLAAVLVTLLVATLRQPGSVMVGDQQAPVAAALIFDTSPRMDYRQQNQTRLEKAQDTGAWLIRQLPPDSQIAVLESRANLATAPRATNAADPSGPRTAGFAVDLAAAEKAIRSLKTTGVPRPLPLVIQESLQLVAENPLTQKEVYVFTDLAQQAWDEESAAQLAERLREHESTALYVIDVGLAETQNFWLGPLRMSTQTLARHGQVEIETEVLHRGPGGSRTVELVLEAPDRQGPLVRDGKTQLPERLTRQQVLCELAENGTHPVRFSIADLPLGVHHGLVRLREHDGLVMDDERSFTVQVQEAWPVLVVAPRGVNTTLLTDALAPADEPEPAASDAPAEADRWGYRCDVIDQADFANQQLGGYAAVVLLNPQPLPPDHWKNLAEYATAGGGVAVFLGHNAEPPGPFNDPSAQELLPGKLARQTRAGGWDLFLSPERFEHPALAAFRALPRESIPWHLFPILRHWDLEELPAAAQVILRYGNRKPALVERAIGEGKVVTMTTPITELARPRGRDPWNEIDGDGEFLRFALVNDLVHYLAQSSADVRLNYEAGEQVVLPNDPRQHPDRYQLFTPLSEPSDVTAASGRLAIKFTEYPGAYRLKGNRGGPVVRGFSVNLKPEASDLRRLPIEQLDPFLGEGRYQLAQDRKQIEFGVRETRVGREFYPYLVMMLVVVLGLEHVFSNRFYRQTV